MQRYEQSLDWQNKKQKKNSDNNANHFYMAKNKELNELIKRIKYQYDLNQGEIASKIGVKDTYSPQ